ncbi:MAG: cytochrome C peroxidase [Deltaproteobacteria bacterium]|nr:MAG: cytochrome C peroxidase [Deltaproteobacteria bacterium]
MVMKKFARGQFSRWLLLPVLAGLIMMPAPIKAQVEPPEPANPIDIIDPLSLKDVPLIVPANIGQFVRDFNALKQLGKALFWDMQVGSDGIQACASCHWNAGADIRRRNMLNPATLAGDVIFGNNFEGVPGHPNFAPDFSAASPDFPFHLRSPRTAPVDQNDPANELETLKKDTNDVFSSMGVVLTQFQGIDGPVDLGTVITPDPIPGFTGIRRVEPRNAPTAINAAFNFDNFWDGRASAIFNGVNPFGFRDRTSMVWRNVGGVLQQQLIRIPNSSLASQAVGPPLSEFEMSWRGRSFPALGKKMLGLRPLGYQKVSTTDSLLGPLSRDPLPGLKTTYLKLIQKAFKQAYWKDPSNTLINGFTLMETNFALFFGLAVQEYEKTLIADDTPFDRFMTKRNQGDPNPPDLNPLPGERGNPRRGLDLFIVEGRCNNCHRLPETTNHSFRNVGADSRGIPQDIVELMVLGDGQAGFYDNGMYNISRRPTEEDIGRGGNAPPTQGFPNGLPLSYTELFFMKRNNQLPNDVGKFVPNNAFDEAGNPVNFGLQPPIIERKVVQGAFKAASLRNLPFTGPYFHDGGDSTLRQAIEFYTRGGNFPATNRPFLDADIAAIPEFVLPAGQTNMDDLIAFLVRGLTDERVVFERAPFDHPELFIPQTGAAPNVQGATDTARNKFLRQNSTTNINATIVEPVKPFYIHPPVGAAGNPDAIALFLNRDPFEPR